jgi:hypothetical protein
MVMLTMPNNEGPWFIMNLPEATPLQGRGNLDNNYTTIALFKTKYDAILALNTKLYFESGMEKELETYYEVMEYEDN